VATLVAIIEKKRFVNGAILLRLQTLAMVGVELLRAGWTKTLCGFRTRISAASAVLSGLIVKLV
jgi:hypothetical protein